MAGLTVHLAADLASSRAAACYIAETHTPLLVWKYAPNMLVTPPNRRKILNSI